MASPWERQSPDWRFDPEDNPYVIPKRGEGSVSECCLRQGTSPAAQETPFHFNCR